MTKPTAPERLSKALCDHLDTLHEWNQEIMKSNIKWGMCVANAKCSPFQHPTKVVMEELVNQAKEYFVSQGVADAFYFQYWTPPAIAINQGRDENAPPVAEDFLLTFNTVYFDDVWVQKILARNLIFCPDKSELGWYHEWYTPQEEAIRLTTLLHKQIEECKIRGEVQLSLLTEATPVFESFLKKYILTDPNIGISNIEKQAYQEGVLNWKTLYPTLSRLVSLNKKNLLQAYRVSRKKAAETRNAKIKALLWAFAEHIEKTFIMETKLSEEIKLELIRCMKGDSKPKSKKKYQAKRPALCLSDVDCGQMLYLMRIEFGKNPKKQQVVGESILFVMIAQHAAFSGLKFKVENILHIKVTDFSSHDLTIMINEEEVQITRGLAQILDSWIGTSQRKNERFFFPTLNYDKLEKCLAKISKGFFGLDGKVIPSDFLHKAHVISGVRIPTELRRRLNEQELLIKGSPYLINIKNIEKCILEAHSKKCS